VRRTPKPFRHLKGFGRFPHFPGKSPNNGQNTSQRTVSRSPEFLIDAGAGRRLSRVATTAIGGSSGPRTRVRPDPFSRPRPRAPPPARPEDIQPKSPSGFRGPTNLISDDP
jgi:hypothetical protein